MARCKPSSEATGKCPICGRTTERAYRPFCSRRCADVDLSRWLRGTYAIPDAESEDGDSAESPDATGDDKDNGRQ